LPASPDSGKVVRNQHRGRKFPYIQNSCLEALARRCRQALTAGRLSEINTGARNSPPFKTRARRLWPGVETSTGGGEGCQKSTQGPGTMGPGTMGPRDHGTMGPGTMGPGTRDHGTIGPGTMGTRDHGTRDHGTRDHGTRDQGPGPGTGTTDSLDCTRLRTRIPQIARGCARGFPGLHAVAHADSPDCTRLRTRIPRIARGCARGFPDCTRLRTRIPKKETISCKAKVPLSSLLTNAHTHPPKAKKYPKLTCPRPFGAQHF
jgi:hypothetical protein